jgi:hypothetical protein
MFPGFCCRELLQAAAVLPLQYGVPEPGLDFWACAEPERLGEKRARRAHIKNVPATGTAIIFICPERGSHAWVRIRLRA